VARGARRRGAGRLRLVAVGLRAAAAAASAGELHRAVALAAAARDRADRDDPGGPRAATARHKLALHLLNAWRPPSWPATGRRTPRWPAWPRPRSTSRSAVGCRRRRSGSGSCTAPGARTPA
jgi:hypothetical protein